MKTGIDVSTHQGKIDWKKVKADGIEFAILRAGYGREISQKDTRFEENYAGCKANGIYTSAYWYSYALTSEAAKMEADVFLKVLDGKTFEYPVYFDIENKTQLALAKKLLQEITVAFCNTIEAAGYWVGIYSYKSFLESNFTPEILERYAIWVAHTGVKQTDFKYQHGIWQYSHTGEVNGINTNVDLNYSYTEYPEIMKSSGLNGFVKPDDTQYTEHTVANNESLWEIANKYLGNGRRYLEIKALNKLESDTIYKGQVLKIPTK